MYTTNKSWWCCCTYAQSALPHL